MFRVMFARPTRSLLMIAAATGIVMSALPAFAQIVPGTGRRIEKVFDDFEDEKWDYDYKLPKSSHEQDDRARYPLARSMNGKWIGSAKRGTPDHVKRVETPAGGLPGSKGALMIRTLHSGVPGVLTTERMQDDLILNMAGRYGMMPASAGPSTVVRVWMPPFEEWDQQRGSHFGIRLGLRTTKEEKQRVLFFSRTVKEPEPYWPGLFIQYLGKQGDYPEGAAAWVVRGANNGGDFRGPLIANPGWWTVGMSVTPDGSIHYYVREGIEDLRAEDRVASTTPYGYRCEKFATIFFNITSRNDGHTWSTPFVIDDPMVFSAR
ncbi:hypothetical protein [Calycomorphotria hydatis]|uniref:Uncharacterized protein n=1 Tax=Calycomorphotria hydatis TaxID=2528027 RepID=A0A517T8F2_9PLAN|nr:hypothetical protein [Calycomorphotria hydatis]QDT64637.1 hypothetical protein V22_18770 [Calycomorphotria hydatis]